MAFDTLALIFACFLAVPGILFMINNSKFASHAASDAGFSNVGNEGLN